MNRPNARSRGLGPRASAHFLVTQLALLALFALTLGLGGCHKKASPKDCEVLLDRFAELVVKERFPDAGAEVIAAERARERSEAMSDDSFKNCTSEVQLSEHACAMKAQSSEALIKCLE